MSRTVRMVVAVVGLVVSALGVTYVLGIRSRNASVRNAARRFHHVVGNPLQMRAAGAAGSHTSVIRHHGRRTGTAYETPVWAAPTEDGFVIGIVYGARTDWVENVLASRTAAIVHDGRIDDVDHPEIVPMDRVRRYFPARTRRLQAPVRVERCLRVRRMAVASGPVADRRPAQRGRRQS